MQFTCFLEAKLKATHFTCTFLYIIMIVAGIIAGGANAGGTIAGGANGLKPISPIIFIFLVAISYISS